ncbi:alpha/beta-hydrolase [Decorospora gaudefroyi]|uniref:Alpha/beta-hydrolase n=1 Tax=Decorospora gaudefroyi TaxID=184978 RepID=A0A6A5KGC4_9PLEO|nr:alpha/beta-hydrolase [Decorospora gaudefroyi]
MSLVNDDPRVEHRISKLNGCTYHYLHALPAGGKFVCTVFLIHGWPDISMGWRCQIPVLVDMGCRVVAMDMMGYGGSDAPPVPPNSISLYGLKRAADDIAALAKELGAPKIVLGGHDWGGFVVWRAAQWHPDLVSHVFSVCTPYTPPQETFFSTEDLVKGPLPQFAYQLHLASGEVEKVVHDEHSIRQFLKGMYGAKGPDGEAIFLPERGVLGENLDKIGEGGLLGGEVLDYYVKQYLKHGIHPTLNWYRTRHQNFLDDQALLDKKTITQPVLFIQATRDNVLKPEMSKNMEKFIPNLTRGEVETGHWALTQKPADVNRILSAWFEAQGLVGSKGTGKSSL